MARPRKETVDYFPHFVSSGKTLFILEQTFGNDGYAFWFKLLELLGKTSGHYYDCNNPPAWRFLQAITHLDEVSTLKMLDLLAELDAIDKELWENRVIWSENFVNNLSPVYNNRKTPLPERPVIIRRNDEVDELLPVETQEEVVSTKKTTENPQVTPITTQKTPQSRVKESIVKDSTVLVLQDPTVETGSSISIDISESFGELSETYQQVIGPVNGIVSDWLDEILDEYGLEWCKNALIEANKNGKRDKAYIQGILKNWKEAGCMKFNTNLGREPPQKFDYETAKKSKYGW